jgi:hypothetical protein
MKVSRACGSMVLFLSFWKKSGSESHFFSKKEILFRPAGGDIHFRTRNRLTCVDLS